MNETDKPSWVADARALLDTSAGSLDAATLSRLNRARQAALAQRRRSVRAWWLPAAGLATTCALVLVLVALLPRERPGVVPAATQPAAVDADSAAADDGIEFYQDLEFYAWLEAQEQDSDG